MTCNGAKKIDRLVEMLESTLSESIFKGCLEVGYNSEMCRKLDYAISLGPWDDGQEGVISFSEKIELENVGFKPDEATFLMNNSLYARAKFYGNRFLDGRHIGDVYKLVGIGRTGGMIKYYVLPTIRAGLSIYKGTEQPVISALIELGDKGSIESLRGIALTQYPPGDRRRSTVRVAVEALSKLGDTELPAILLEVGGWVFVENPKGLPDINTSIKFNDGDKLAEYIKRMLLSGDEELELFALGLLGENERLFDDNRQLGLLELACTIQNQYVVREAIHSTQNLLDSQKLKKFLLTQAISADPYVRMWVLNEIADRNYTDLIPTILADWFERRPERLLAESSLGSFDYYGVMCRFWDVLLPHLEHQLKTNPNENARLLALDIAGYMREVKESDVERLVVIAKRDSSPRVRNAANLF